MLIIVALVVAVVIVAIIASQYIGHGKISTGSPAPNFSLTDTNGVTVTLSLWKGSPVLIEFMDVDCPYCKEEAPVLQTLYVAYNAQGAKFVSIDMNFEGPADTPYRVNSFRTNYSTPWSYCLDTGQSVVAAYGVSSTPTVFIVDKAGNVYGSYVGVNEASQSNLAAALKATLGG